MTGTVCDNCEAVSTDRDDLSLHWLSVGYHDGPTFDACSVPCVRQLLRRQIAPTLLRVERVEGAAE